MSDKKDTLGSIVMFTLDRHIDRRILLEAESLQGEGWQVTVVAMPPEENDTEDPVYVSRIASGGSGQAEGGSLLLYLNRLASKFLPRNGKVFHFARCMVWKFVRRPDSFFSRLFAEAVEKYDADVYVAHDLPMLPVAAAAAQCHGGKLVYDSHELFVEQELTAMEQKMWTAIEKEHISSFNAVITVNASIARELETRYKLPRVAVVQNCELSRNVSETYQKLFHDHFGLPNDAKILLFQGGLAEGRNLETLICSMSYIHISGLHLVVLGDGVVVSSLQQLTRSLKLSGKVHFHPAVPQKELLHYTAAADVGIIPYQPTCLNNYYCTPNKLFEFIAAGIPIIATDLPEIRRIVNGNHIGMVGDTAAAKSLAGLIDTFFSDSELLKQCQATVLQVRKKINWQAESRGLISLYRKLLDDQI